MEIQIPLVLFTSLLAWAAGIFGTQCILALKKQGSGIQVASLVCAAVILVVGGIAVVFHLTNPFNLFNGFGHITSGITQELIAIVLLAIVMVLYFLMLRRSDDNTVPSWLAIVGLVLCVVLVIAMGHSYMMASRPTWNSVLQLLSLAGAACVLGPATIAIIATIKGVQVESLGVLNVCGSIANAVLSLAFMATMQMAAGSFQSFQYYFDPTHPNHALVNSSNMSLFSSDCICATFVALIGLAVAVFGAFMGKKSGNWKLWGAIIVIAGLACAIALRIAMYVMGETLFMLY